MKKIKARLDCRWGDTECVYYPECLKHKLYRYYELLLLLTGLKKTEEPDMNEAMKLVTDSSDSEEI